VKKNVKKPKEEVINVRLTTEQKQSLELAAASEGMGLSTWLLRLGIVERVTALYTYTCELCGPFAVYARKSPENETLVTVPATGTLPYEVITAGGSSGRLTDVLAITSAASSQRGRRFQSTLASRSSKTPVPMKKTGAAAIM
jgi:hypothetical protein